MADLRSIIDHRHDSIVLIDLGVAGRPNSAKIETMGRGPKLPSDGPTII
jgi:hypothetical protein